MHFFLPRRVLAVIFSALLGVLAFSSVASAGIGVPARLVEHDSRSKMTIVDDESWPSSDEVETFSLVNEPSHTVWAGSAPSYWTTSRCAGNEVKVLVRLKVEHMWTDYAKVTARADLYEGQACNTSDLDGTSGDQFFYIPRGQNMQIKLYVHNDQEGGDYANINLSLTNYSIVF